MTFPEKTYGSVEDYTSDYFDKCAQAARSVSGEALDKAMKILETAYLGGHWVYACGNGGSASIADHLTCDHGKCVRTDTPLMPRVMSLTANVAMLTAIANDISYEDVYVYQLQGIAQAGDVLVTISSSGDSENIVRALSWARDNGVHTIAMSGFDGGRSKDLADVALHVDGDNYGIIEDVHQGLMHALSQYIRQVHMDPALITERKF
ncbi:MAG: SIS domain-containing protein [Rhodospirillales bacterium]|jgi:phosphoheptose isomerase|nr:SIS domain-containing protein [Rhodospirillales bacterium]MBT4006531.1 SIS domain-containing protein [Rhodospirillales bacterium]MBT5076750.1 SIS domain-containing protein [Rhodospirillales bacterium]MBT5113809.1 SIS domain-containing protein [Rhodospirillales bacterium]MBT5672337.1 SIS domain-containing protein [Rhodospirillales bacterium]